MRGRRRLRAPPGGPPAAPHTPPPPAPGLSTPDPCPALAPQPPPEGGPLQPRGAAQLAQIHAHPPELVRPRPQASQGRAAPCPPQRPPRARHGAERGGERPPSGRCRPLLRNRSAPAAGSMSASSSRRKSKGRPAAGGGSPRDAPLGAAAGGLLALRVTDAVEAGTGCGRRGRAGRLPQPRCLCPAR